MAAMAFVRRESCPLCRSGDVRTVYRSRFDEGPIGAFVHRYYRIDPRLLSAAPYELARCQGCTLLYQAWVGDDRLLAELYGEWINESNRPDEDPLYRSIMARPLESRDAHEILVAATFLGVEPSKMRTLDYGMGWAMWARVASTLGCRSFGTELSPARVDFAREHGVTTLGEDEIAGQRFDFINTEQVMEHVTQLRPSLDRLASALRPGGILKISVPAADHAAAIVESLRSGTVPSDEAIMPVQPLEHVNSFTRQALRRLASELGLEPVRPSIAQRYAFLRTPGAIGLVRPRNAAKELVRPFYQYWNPRNHYLWLRNVA